MPLIVLLFVSLPDWGSLRRIAVDTSAQVTSDTGTVNTAIILLKHSPYTLYGYLLVLVLLSPASLRAADPISENA